MKHRPKIRPPIPPYALPLLCCLAAAAGCDSRQLLAPSTRTAAPSTLDASSDASVIGAATVAPEQTGGVSIGAVPESTWVVIQVSGEYDAKPNPACAAQPPNWPCIFNPPASNFYDPAPFTSGPVQAWVTNATRTSQVQLRGTGGAVNTAGQAVGLYFAPAAGQLVVLSALQNFGTQNPNPVGQVSSWIFSGGYNATATTIHPLTFSGGPTGAPQGTVTFTVGTTAPLQFINPVGFGAAPPGNVDWYFVPGDSVPLNYERTSQAWQVFACYRQTTCTVTPPPNLNGRMQVEAYVEGKLVIGRSDYVRGKPKLTGTLGVSCRPDSLIVGNTTTCTATATPASSRLIVQTWQFTDDSSKVSMGINGDSTVWTFRPTVRGTVTVTGTVDGVLQVATTRVEVLCNMLQASSADSLLNDLHVQQGMRQYWAASHPNDSIVANRREQGGMIVRDSTGNLSVVPFSSNSNPHLCSATLNGADFQPIFQSGGTVVASFHTHPHDPGNPPPTNCNIRGAQLPGAVFGDGASIGDYRAVNAPSFVLPMYIVDRSHVHRILPGEQFSKRVPPHTENRSLTCN